MFLINGLALYQICCEIFMNEIPRVKVTDEAKKLLPNFAPNMAR